MNVDGSLWCTIMFSAYLQGLKMFSGTHEKIQLFDVIAFIYLYKYIHFYLLNFIIKYKHKRKVL